MCKVKPRARAGRLRVPGDLASTYRNQGRWKDAEQLDLQVMETRKTKLGADHPSTLTSMNNLASTFKGLGEVQQAISLMQDCCPLQEQVLGPYHPNTVSSQETGVRHCTRDIMVGDER